MKSICILKERLNKWLLNLFILVLPIYVQAQYYDDIPPEFGLDDDPEPGAPIDVYIPIVILLMVVFLAHHFYKKQLKSKNIK